ncbi:MAG TPA: deoxynucleoside kinase, partial [Anaerolineae bacterium]|nr:deoxynucleoside kinase [Anaerolineae bacterium]
GGRRKTRDSALREEKAIAMEDRKMILLEGNIGAGKSTMGKILKTSGLFDFIEEPVQAWQEGFAANLLDAFYSDMERWAFTFQITAFVTRAKTWQEVLALTDHSRVVLERSIFTDRYVFATNSHRLGGMTNAEWQVYCGLWDFLATNYCVEPECILYYRTPAEICVERMKARGRSEESGVSLEYLRQLEALHDQWLLEHPGAVVLDGTKVWTAEEVWNLMRPHLGER